MKQIRDLFQRIGLPLEAAAPIPPGTYAYQTPPDADTQFRLHLRVEPDGNGLMIVNASTILHLNQTAVDYAYHLVQQTPEDEVGRIVSARYRVSPEQARQDFVNIRERIHSLILEPDLDPVSFLDFDRQTPYTGLLSAPLRADLALTYRTSDGETDPRISPQDRVRRELATDEWTTIIQKTWEAGIPHLIFSGGEPTLRADLVDLIRLAERQGQITGLISDGSRLSDPHYRHELLQTGLDHLMFILRQDEEESWEALRDILAEDLFTTVHVTLDARNHSSVGTLLGRLKELGCNSISLSAANLAYASDLQNARNEVARLEMSLVWDLPVPYSALHPVSLETQGEGPSGAGTAWIYLEPDGDVLPSQGGSPVLGNLLEQGWADIAGRLNPLK
jgi:hypothetical protein